MKTTLQRLTVILMLWLAVLVVASPAQANGYGLKPAGEVREYLLEPVGTPARSFWAGWWYGYTQAWHDRQMDWLHTDTGTESMPFDQWDRLRAAVHDCRIEVDIEMLRDHTEQAGWGGRALSLDTPIDLWLQNRLYQCVRDKTTNHEEK